jgi:hypothetical protein
MTWIQQAIKIKTELKSNKFPQMLIPIKKRHQKIPEMKLINTYENTINIKS